MADDRSPYRPRIKASAAESILPVTGLRGLKGHRVLTLERCVNNIKEGRAVVTSLKVCADARGGWRREKNTKRRCVIGGGRESWRPGRSRVFLYSIARRCRFCPMPARPAHGRFSPLRFALHWLRTIRAIEVSAMKSSATFASYCAAALRRETCCYVAPTYSKRGALVSRIWLCGGCRAASQPSRCVPRVGQTSQRLVVHPPSRRVFRFGWLFFCFVC